MCFGNTSWLERADRENVFCFSGPSRNWWAWIFQVRTVTAVKSQLRVAYEIVWLLVNRCVLAQNFWEYLVAGIKSVVKTYFASQTQAGTGRALLKTESPESELQVAIGCPKKVLKPIGCTVFKPCVNIVLLQIPYYSLKLPATSQIISETNVFCWVSSACNNYRENPVTTWFSK